MSSDLEKVAHIATYHEYTDVRAEVVAADAIDMGIRLGNISIRPVGISKRTYSRDIQSAAIVSDQSGKAAGLRLDVNREGLYDMLPEGLFHQPDPMRRSMKVHDVVEEIKRARREEEDARKFFFPIEKEINRQRILIELEERKSYEDYSDHYKNQLFFKLWPELTNLRKEYVNPLVKILPRAAEIAGTLDKTEYCFRKVLGVELSLFSGEQVYTNTISSYEMRLGEIAIGADACLGSWCVDADSSVIILIGPLSKDRLKEYFPGGQAFKAIEVLQKYFLPVECIMDVQIVLNDKEDQLILSNAEQDGVLGFTSKI